MTTATAVRDRLRTAFAELECVRARMSFADGLDQTARARDATTRDATTPRD